MTLEQKGYEISRRISAYLKSKGISAPFYKYGVDVATYKKDLNDTQTIRYPYFQFATVGDPKQNSWTTEAGGILTLFDYQLNFYTGPKNEKINDEKFFYPFNVAKNIMSDVKLQLLKGVATILKTSGPYKWEIKSGQSVPSASVLYSMRAVCSYEAIVPPATETTDLSKAFTLEVKE